MNSAAVLNRAPQVTTAKDNILCVILSFNGSDDTISCIKSIVDQKQNGLDLLVIDNGSSAGTVDNIVAAQPSIELIALPENLGWAGGNNVGMKIAFQRGYNWVCLLNNDTVFPDGEVANWINAIRTAPPCLLHPTIHYWDQPEVAQINTLGELNGLPNCQGALWHGKIMMGHAYGACLAIPRVIFESVGFLDERLFLQLEETDFHRRSMQKGYHAACDPTVKIFHKESRSFGGVRAPIKIYYTIRNSLLLIEKTPGSWRQKLHRIKELYWTITQIALRDCGARHLGLIPLIRWMISRTPSATSVRAGTVDYIFRRFGRISPRIHSRIKDSEAKAAVQESTANAV